MVSIQKINKDNIHQIHDLAWQIWPKSFEHILSKEQIAYMMEMMYAVPVLRNEIERGVEYYILTYQNENAGFTAIEKKDNISYKLHKIYLNHQLQGKGLGKYQLRAMEQIVKNYGAHSLYLNVNRHNKAVGFYQSQGYHIIKEEDNDIGNGYFMNDFVMMKKL